MKGTALQAIIVLLYFCGTMPASAQSTDAHHMTLGIEAIGFAGSFFAVVTYLMKDMRRLRIAAVLSSMFFITYAVMIGSYPVLIMELILLPISAWRLMELQAQRTPAGSSTSEHLRRGGWLRSFNFRLKGPRSLLRSRMLG